MRNFRLEIKLQNVEGIFSGSFEALGANLWNLWNWKRERESAISFSIPGTCSALNWILLCIVAKTNGRISCITRFDFEVLLLIIETKAELSVLNKIFLF